MELEYLKHRYVGQVVKVARFTVEKTRLCLVKYRDNQVEDIAVRQLFKDTMYHLTNAYLNLDLFLETPSSAYTKLIAQVYGNDSDELADLQYFLRLYITMDHWER